MPRNHFRFAVFVVERREHFGRRKSWLRCMYAGYNRRGSEKSEDTTMQVPGRIVHWKLNAFSVTVARGRIRRCLYNTFRACFRVTTSQPGVYRSISVVFVPYLRKFDRAEGLSSLRTGDIYLSPDRADVARCGAAFYFEACTFFETVSSKKTMFSITPLYKL